MQLRDAQPFDFDAILALNAAEQQQTSALDAAGLARLHALACRHRVALVDGRVAGFVLAMRSDAAYDNDNFRWFAARFTRFVYVDRIVVGAAFAGRGIGSALYDDLLEDARRQGDDRVVCEYNLMPPNPGSAKFHAKYGFSQVGVLDHALSGKRVSMQALSV